MSMGSQAERLDLAVDQLLAGARPPVDGGLSPLLDAAILVREAMPPLPTGERFDAQMLSRLGERGGVSSAVGALERMARRELQHPVRILAAGAVSSAAVGVTVTAFAVWRSRRHATAGLGRK